MEKYAIFSYTTTDAPVQGNFTVSENVTRPDLSEEQRREWLDRLFGDKNADFPVQRIKKNDVLADKYPTVVLAHTDSIVLLRVINPRVVTVFEEHESMPGTVSNIDKREYPSSPYFYVLLDWRENHNHIAIEIDSNVWRNTDTFAKVLQDSINKVLDDKGLGFWISLCAETMHIDFLEHSRKLIKKDKLPMTKMTIYFTRGLINPEIEAKIREDAYLRDLNKRMFEANAVELNYFNPNGLRLLDERGRMLEHFVALIASEPHGAFRLKTTYADGMSYSCGKEARMEFPMDNEAFSNMLGYGTLFPGHAMGDWFDKIVKKLDEQKHDQNTQREGA